MSKRTHNLYFHLHTVSGISIAVALFVIFVAGAFTLFVEAIEAWEKGADVTETVTARAPVDYNRVMDSLKTRGISLYGRDIRTTDAGTVEQPIYLSGSADSLAAPGDKKPLTLILNTDSYQIREATPFYSLGDLLYELHFFNQLGRVGYYLSAVISLFFLFAMVSGIILHWKKIRLNFSVFRPRQKLKTVWTDAHTALGVIGIPFQFMYALTGAMFGLSILVALFGSLMYGGSMEKYNASVYGGHSETLDHLGSRTDVSQIDYNAFRDKADQHWDGFRGKFLGILHYGTTTQQFRSYGYVDVKDRFLNEGEVVFDMHSGAVIEEHDPYDRLYTDNIWPTVYRLHFANYGDIGTFSTYLLKTLYFFMAILTCFVIISGILIWLEARKRLDVSERRRKYNTQVGHIFMAICMSILPVTAAAFSYSRLLPPTIGEHRELALNCFYFIGWLTLALVFWYGQDNIRTSRRSLAMTGALGLTVPVVNGLASGNWIWRSYAGHEYGIFFIDLLWIAIAASCLYAWNKMRKTKPKAKESLAGATVLY